VELLFKRIPSENSYVVVSFNDFLLQALKRLVALTVDQGHVDIKQAEQTVRRVFFTFCLASSSPGHLRGNADRLFLNTFQ
jgi:hypothetical protein